MQHQDSGYPTIAVNTANGIVFLKVQDVLYCKASGSYTEVYLSGAGKNKVTIAKTLSKVLDSLPGDQFVRIHNSFVINTYHLIRFNNSDKNCVTMSDGTALSVSRGRKDAFLKKFNLI